MMATGYTAKLSDGEQSFEDFVLGCACAFFYDTSKLPEKWKVKTSYADSLKEHQAELAKVKKMGMAEAKREADKEFAKAKAEHEKDKRERAAAEDRLMAMRAKVADWEPPTAKHVRLKKLMLQQIDETINFDCVDYDGGPSKRMSGGDWLRSKIAELKRDIEYDSRHYAEEVKRTNERNEWCDALRKSLAERKGKRVNG
jgi:hypothetical protein